MSKENAEKVVEEVEENVDQGIDHGEVEEEKEKPFWLEDEEPSDESDDDADGSEGEDDNEGSGDVPVKTHVRVKQKLKGKLKDAESELEKLRREMEELRSGKQEQNQAAPSGLQPPKRPRRTDFDDDDAYETAMDKYEDQRRQFDTQVLTQTSQQRQQAQKRLQEIEQAADAHYERAEKIVQEYGIKPEVYQSADKTVKEIFQTIIPEMDPELVFNGFVDMIGEGSEIAMYHIGRNKSAGDQFARLLAEDKSGLKASMYLGRIAERVGGTKGKLSSQAPAPPTKLKGDKTANLKEGTARRKWQEAHKKGKTQEAYNLKKAAKSQGIDVSSWK